MLNLPVAKVFENVRIKPKIIYFLYSIRVYLNPISCFDLLSLYSFSMLLNSFSTYSLTYTLSSISVVFFLSRVVLYTYEGASNLKMNKNPIN